MPAPMFTKRHYRAIAETLRDNTLDSDDTPKFALMLCHLFEEDNPTFEVHPFLVACGVKSDE